MDKIKKFRLSSESRQSKEYDSNSNCVVKSKKKKLSLTKELIGGIEHFKKALSLGFQKKNKNIDFLDPIKGESVKVDCEDTKKTKNLWNVSLKALEQLIAKERRLRQDYEVNLIRHLDRLKQLDRVKGEHAKQLEQTLADEDRVITALRTDIKNTNEEFENCRLRFFRFYMESFGRSTLIDAAKAFSQACKNAEMAVTATSVLSGVNGETSVKTVAQIKVQKRCPSRKEIVQVAERRLSTVSDELVRLSEGNKDWLAIWYAAVSAHQNNIALESTADVLDSQTDMLQDRLSHMTARHAELNAHKNERQIEAVVLDEFYAVTEEINAQQLRSLEFSRLLAEDDDELLEDMEMIQQLKEKIAEKKRKKQQLLEKRGIIKSELDIYKNQYEELMIKKSRLTEDVINVQKSPSKLLNQSELRHYQVHGQQQRVKHLKQLKIQFNKLTNKRDVLKQKLQTYQQDKTTLKQVNKLYPKLPE
ncbi:uncharacterized protein LOC126898807 isoform X2 [Daktulosphaira vitifoliae]|uniref:uncharacterized protein LOC126898807 isoform X2 n=1 Tax=Daktulosphaira vitifoliae TaxID=58002 RepID=UPI0021AA5A26|nr:uncharacterized protein LOC126898807 isoform X2 [Daktulosphaira vitifoliae]